MKMVKTHNMSYLFIALGIVFLLGFFPMMGIAMTMFSGKEEDVVLFSPMSGYLTFHDKPAANAKMVRWIVYKDKTGEKEIFYSDEKGFFQLPLKKASMKLSPLVQLSISQEINVFFDNQEFLIWTMGKGSKELFGELGGEPVNFQCELSNDLVRVEVPNGLLGTICTWDFLLKK